MENENKIIKKAQKGDQQAFALLYRHYNPPIYRYLYSRVGNQTDAEELTSRTFLSALENISRYHHKGYFAAWLFTIAKNKITDFYREQNKNLSLEEQPSHITLLESPHIFENIIATEQAQKLAHIIAALPPHKQEWLRLRFVAQLPYQEIGRIFGKNTEAIKKSIYRLLEEIRQKMELQA